MKNHVEALTTQSVTHVTKHLQLLSDEELTRKTKSVGSSFSLLDSDRRFDLR